jgi:DNA repair exonuclease SbcCD ATPase subunit
MSEFIEVLSPSALKDLQTLNAEITKTVSGVKEVNANMINVKTPSGADSAIKKLQTEVQKLHDTQVKAQIQLEKYAQAQARTKIANNQAEASTVRLEQAIDRKNKALEREVAKLQASQNLYNKVQQKLNALSNEYKALAIRQEISGKLTEKEAQRYEFLQGKIQKYDGALKAVDASMGKYQRNVGNYASAFNPLGNSINQLTREMPAFANSVQTGFMAISNNLPIFFDSMQQAIAQQKELQAQGQPSKNALQLLAGSFLTMGTALSVGVTLLTVYGAEIVNAITGSKDRAKALEAEKKALEQKAQAEDEARGKLASYQSEEISRSKILLENAKNLELPYKRRVEAVKELQERYPDYLGNLSQEKILAGDTADAELRLNDALVKRGIALASQQLIQEEINNSLKNEKWLADQLNEVQTKRADLARQLSAIDPFTKNKDLQEKYNDIQIQLERLFYLEGTLNEQYKTKNKTIQDSIKFYIDQYNANAKYLDTVNDVNDKDKKGVEIKREQIEAVKMQANEVQGLINKLNALKSALEKQRNEESKSVADYEKFTTTIDAVQRSIDGLTTGYKDLTASGEAGSEEFLRLNKNMRTVDDTTKQLSQNVSDYLKTFQEGFFSDAGMPTLFKVLNKDIEGFGENFAVTFNTMAEIAQEAFAIISEASNANFQNEYANLERQRDIALMFAGDSASAREEIERQAEAKRRNIQRREFQAQKQQALFNIAINTAQAIIATLARTPLPAGLPLVIATGALGALQAGIVASQQMPAFWKGTDNAPEGWAWTQEKGREVILDKNGNVKSLGSDKGATATYLNKGDKVLTAEKTMDFLMFNDDLNNILTGNGINMPKIEVNNQGMTDSQVNAIVSAIKTKETANISIDKRGIRDYVTNGRQITERLNNRVTFKGTSV